MSLESLDFSMSLVVKKGKETLAYGILGKVKFVLNNPLSFCRQKSQCRYILYFPSWNEAITWNTANGQIMVYVYTILMCTLWEKAIQWEMLGRYWWPTCGQHIAFYNLAISFVFKRIMWGFQKGTFLSLPTRPPKMKSFQLFIPKLWCRTMSKMSTKDSEGKEITKSCGLEWSKTNRFWHFSWMRMPIGWALLHVSHCLCKLGIGIFGQKLLLGRNPCVIDILIKKLTVIFFKWPTRSKDNVLTGCMWGIGTLIIRL
jgi:hypothetical protein